MTDVNEQLEKLMVRSLDGALNEDDELALNRELIRNPQARQLMASYRTVDELAVAALDEVATGEAPVIDARAWTRPGSSKRPVWQRRTWFWLAPGAIAAALLALIVPKPSPITVETSPLVQSSLVPKVNPLDSRHFGDGQRDLMHSVRSTPAIHRNTGREIIGVVGDDGNLYWIEVERTRTVTLPAGSSSRAVGLGTM